jgi:hypothetical protein
MKSVLILVLALLPQEAVETWSGKIWPLLRDGLTAQYADAAPDAEEMRGPVGVEVAQRRCPLQALQAARERAAARRQAAGDCETAVPAAGGPTGRGSAPIALPPLDADPGASGDAAGAAGGEWMTSRVSIDL